MDHFSIQVNQIPSFIIQYINIDSSKPNNPFSKDNTASKPFGNTTNKPSPFGKNSHANTPKTNNPFGKKKEGNYSNLKLESLCLYL